MTGGSQRRVRRISSRDDTASAQVQITDPPDPPLLADGAVLLGLREVKLGILVKNVLACAVDAADCKLRISKLFTCNIVQMARIVKQLRPMSLRFGWYWEESREQKT